MMAMISTVLRIVREYGLGLPTIISTSSTFVGTILGAWRAVGRLWGGARHHLSRWRACLSLFIEIRRIVFTSPPALTSHHCASTIGVSTLEDDSWPVRLLGSRRWFVRCIGFLRQYITLALQGRRPSFGPSFGPHRHNSILACLLGYSSVITVTC